MGIFCLKLSGLNKGKFSKYSRVLENFPFFKRFWVKSLKWQKREFICTKELLGTKWIKTRYFKKLDIWPPYRAFSTARLTVWYSIKHLAAQLTTIKLWWQAYTEHELYQIECFKHVCTIRVCLAYERRKSLTVLKANDNRVWRNIFSLKHEVCERHNKILILNKSNQ